MLAVEALEVRYGKAVAVSGAALHVAKGSWTTLIGSNGAGKSSLMRAVMGLARYGGSITLDGADLHSVPAWERQRLGLGFVPEGRQLFGDMTVEENLRVGGYNCEPAALRQGMEHIYALFPRLAERRKQAASTLSGGEQQMLALGRALVGAPRLLLIDEISWGLMPLLVTQVFALLKKLHAEGMTILQVEQNTHEVLKHAEHAYVMAGGQIAFHGPASSVARDARVLENYVG
jgi:branched-chain amino acid transport system ATP-binding protein